MTSNERKLNKIRPVLNRILALQPAMQALSDEALRAKTDEFRARLEQGESEDSLLPEAYAVVREAAKRVLKMEHFPVQLIGGIILHQGRVAEMRTGEGKTLVATLPAYLNALSGRGVHVITTNDYLAGRDSEEMGKVHTFLGLTVGTVLGGMSTADRKKAYACDITYTTNSELGFDYLRDNMAKSADQIVQRGFHYCIIDEADSVLLDDAGTPLVISGAAKRSTKLYGACDVLARRMERGEEPPELSKIDMMAGIRPEESGDYIVYEKEKRVSLTAKGIRRVEKYFSIDNFADTSSLLIRHNMDLALRANAILEKDKDYVVSDGEVLIVDGLTGRTMPGRRYSDGLHQAVEAKEHVRIHPENQTSARISYQNFFHKYEKLAGMTGTGRAQEKEFIDVYGMDIVVVPTNNPIQRIDREDLFYPTKEAKFKAVCARIREALLKQQPVLVGTVSIADSEELSGMFNALGIRHSVLNAKQHEKEAAIVKKAGHKGAVTIATNMAGRGTDIKLDKTAKEAGGLLVIGTERFDSRRIDDQLCGRAGRQGDVGESCFLLSLDDGLLKRFPKNRVEAAYAAGHSSSGEDGIPSAALSRMIRRSQQAMESENAAQRKKLMEFDAVLGRQRELVYESRRRVIMDEDVHGLLSDIFALLGEDALSSADPAAKPEEQLASAAHYFDGILSFPAIRALSACRREDFAAHALEELSTRLEQIEASFGDAAFLAHRERELLLETADKYWAQQMEDMELLRDGISLVSYAQKNPVIEYAKQAFALFGQMNRSIRRETALSLLNAADLN